MSDSSIADCGLRIADVPVSVPHTALARVCIVTHEINGPSRNGGIGTAYSALAHLLANAGHEVTVLCLEGNRSDRRSFRHWQDHYRQKKIRLEPLPGPDVPLLAPDYLARSYQAYRWLREQTFDLIHFHEWLGGGYWSLLAKHQGLAFGDTTLCVGVHSPTRWIAEANQKWLDDVDELERDAVERRCVELADVVWSPSAYMLRWMRERAWTLPERTFVQPYTLPASGGRQPPVGDPQQGADAPRSPRVVKEVVFFGRLEVRKGLLLFRDALDRLARDVSDLTVTFLGKPTMIDGDKADALVREWSRRWPFRCQMLTNRDQGEALEYLKGANRLAVMPSLMDNSPLTVLECLQAGVPFQASAVGGVPEVVAAEDHGHVLFEPNAKALAARLRDAIRDGVQPARPAVDQYTNRDEWRQWHDITYRTSKSHRTYKSYETPLISVCLTTHERPHFLRQAVESLRHQDYPHFEVILIDDGSSSPAALTALKELKPDFERRGWRIVWQDNRYLGAARNAAVRDARGEFLLFMDDDNLALPNEISTLVAVAQRTGADVVTALMDFFSEVGPDGEPVRECRWLCSGVPALVVGLSRNCFGDANALVRRAAFDAVGGFTEDRGITHEDWEFFVKVVMHGLKLEVVPEALFWYRVTPDSMIRRTPRYHNYLRHLRPYLEEVPEPYRDIIRLAQGLSMRCAEPPTLWQPGRRSGSKPLRYEIADAINERLKPLKRLHGLGRRLIQSVLRFVRGGGS